MCDIEDIIPFSEWKQKHISRGVAQWYGTHGRPLPWRKPPINPYGVWVSEIMAQQTQISTMLPYWNRWMKSFPTIKALASASEESVREHWAGLGYYRRAANLQNGARHVVKTFPATCELPQTMPELLEVPGIGPYTAAAIASICFGIPSAVVDGNVLRVVARLRGEVDVCIKDRAVVTQTWASANKLLAWAYESKIMSPGDWNQAMMEVGATICKPSGPPQCDQCPFASVCRSKALVDKKVISQIDKVIPLVRPRTKQRSEHVVSCLCTCDDQVLLLRRPATGLLANLFEIPTKVIGEEASSVASRVSMAKSLQKELAELFEDGKERQSFEKQCLPAECCEARHLFSHIDMIFHVFQLDFTSAPKLKAAHKDRAQWVARSKLSEIAVAGTVKKVLNAAAGGSTKSSTRKRARQD